MLILNRFSLVIVSSFIFGASFKLVWNFSAWHTGYSDSDALVHLSPAITLHCGDENIIEKIRLLFARKVSSMKTHENIKNPQFLQVLFLYGCIWSDTNH